MNTQFNVQDSVQLLHGYTPTMTISEINSDTEQALCVWYDAQKTRTIKKDWIPLSALKKTPEKAKLSGEDLLSIFGRQ